MDKNVYVVDVVNCERFIKTEKEYWAKVPNEESTYHREFIASYFSLMDPDGNIVCRVDMANPLFFDEENRKNGFKVTVDNDTDGKTYCRVVYEPSNFKRPGKRFMLACGLLSLLLIAGLGFWALKHWSRPSPEEQKYKEIQAMFDKMVKDEVPDTAQFISLIDSCAIYGIDEKGEYTGNNDDFNSLAYKVVQKLKDDKTNRAAALYLLYMKKFEPDMANGVNISAMYQFTDKPSFKSDKYVEEVKNIILNNPPSQADATEVDAGTDDAQATAPSDNAGTAGTKDETIVKADDKAKADAGAKDEVKNDVYTQKDKQLKDFKALYDGLSKKTQISKKAVGDVRNAYKKLDKDQQKQFDVKKIEAYEALAMAHSAIHIKKVLVHYGKYYSPAQKAALEIINGDNYGPLVRDKGYIDINYINKNAKK